MSLPPYLWILYYLSFKQDIMLTKYNFLYYLPFTDTRVVNAIFYGVNVIKLVIVELNFVFNEIIIFMNVKSEIIFVIDLSRMNYFLS